MADAPNRRLHHTLTAEGPTDSCAREQTIRVGDIIVSRDNDAHIPVHAAPGADRGDPEQVRNGSRWRVAGVDQTTNRIAAEPLTHNARVVFEEDYLREHVSLGYAVTVHSAQGVTADTAHAVIGETASRALAYVGMSRGPAATTPTSTPDLAAKPTTNTPPLSPVTTCTCCAAAPNTPPPTTSG
jgi:ATP-dependent exoDNAse (exonuclease V) alpha subunit